MKACIHYASLPTLSACIFASLLMSGLAQAEGQSASPVAPVTPAPARAAASATPAAAIPDDAVLARVDGAPITQRDVRLAIEDLGDRLPRLNEESRQDYVLSYLVDLWLGSRAAVAAKLDTTPAFERKAAYNRNKLLLDELLAQEARTAVTPEAARKTYQQTLKDVKPEEEIRARHILTSSEERALAAIARLKAGEDFAKVAAEMSSDPGAAKTGGELGWFSRDRMAPEFSEVAFRLKIDEISAPVKTQFGWHVIQLEERRTRPAASFEEVRPEVEAYLARKAQQDLVLSLRSKAKIERFAPPVASKTDAAAPPTPAPNPPSPTPPAAMPPANDVAGKPGERGKTRDDGKTRIEGKARDESKAQPQTAPKSPVKTPPGVPDAKSNSR